MNWTPLNGPHLCAIADNNRRYEDCPRIYQSLYSNIFVNTFDRPQVRKRPLCSQAPRRTQNGSEKNGPNTPQIHQHLKPPPLPAHLTHLHPPPLHQKKPPSSKPPSSSRPSTTPQRPCPTQPGRPKPSALRKHSSHSTSPTRHSSCANSQSSSRRRTLIKS